VDDLRPTRTREPDVSVVPAAVQLTAALVFVTERGQSPEQFSHEREASFAFGRVRLPTSRLD
jgi:hypothetical protein